MKKYALVGYPCAHSLSPAIHNAGFEALSIDAEFEIFETRNLKEFMAKVQSGEITGGSVTMPYKRAILPFLTELDESAEMIGACNCFNGLKGYNTDCDGAVRALTEVTELSGQRIYLLGAGGAASAIAFGLRFQNVSVFNLDLSGARKLADKYHFQARELKDLDSEYDILINATSCGFKNDESCVPVSLLDSGKVVFDIVYEPLETGLIRDAREAGCTVITGDRMLLHQGAKAFEIWTGERAPLEVMGKALLFGQLI